MKYLSRTLLIGLSVLLPVALSVQLVAWLVRTIDHWSQQVWLLFLPEDLLFPGLATGLLLLSAFVIGLTTRHTFLAEVWKLPGKVLERLPGVKLVYGMIKDFLDLMSGKPFAEQSVVWVTIGSNDSRVLGIVTKTGKDSNSRLGSMMKEDEVAVFLPMSYQAGGYTVVLPKSCIEPADMEPGEALQLIMSAGLGQGKA